MNIADLLRNLADKLDSIEQSNPAEPKDFAQPDQDNDDDQGVMVPPLQQELELLKQQGGKESPVINQLINQDPHDPDDFANHEHKDDQGPTDEVVRDEDESDLVLNLLKKRRDRLEQQ